MAQCPHASSCPLYPLFTLKGMLKVWQTNYCESEYERCERFKRSTAGLSVPPNMLPNGRLLGGGDK